MEEGMRGINGDENNKIKSKTTTTKLKTKAHRTSIVHLRIHYQLLAVPRCESRFPDSQDRFSRAVGTEPRESFGQCLSRSFALCASCFQAHYDLAIAVALQWLDRSEDLTWLEWEKV